MTRQVSIEILCNHLYMDAKIFLINIDGGPSMRQHNTHLTNSVQSHDPLNFLFFGIKDLYSFFAFPYKSECVLLATKKTKTEREIIIKLITPFALLSQPLGGLENTLL